MSRSRLLRGASALLLAGSAIQADIVWQGRRVAAWPVEAIAPAPAGGAARSLASAGASHYPSPKGTVYGLTLLVDFPDQHAPVTSSEISDWLNLPGFNRNGCNGSVRDYYRDVSAGKVDYVNEVFGWFRARHPKSWYEGLPGYDGSDSLLEEVLVHFDSSVDFSRYDNDKDGTVEALSIVYAGAGLNWAQGLWPHAGWVGKTRDRTKLDRYQMSDMPGTFGIYTFVHESGHMLFGWPDLYWYGDYCTMGNRPDDQNPVAINDFFRADQGWIPFQDVTTLDTGVVVAPADSVVYRLRNPARPDIEGFAWSYLRNVGRRSVIKGSGLFLQHYDFSISGNNSATQLQLRPVQADGLEELQADQWPTKSNDPKDLFQSGTTDHFDASFPASKWYSGSASGLVLAQVGKPGTTLSFRLGKVPPTALGDRTNPGPIEVRASGGGWTLTGPAGLAGAQARIVSADGRILSQSELSASASGSIGTISAPTAGASPARVWLVVSGGRIVASGSLPPRFPTR